VILLKNDILKRILPQNCRGKLYISTINYNTRFFAVFLTAGGDSWGGLFIYIIWKNLRRGGAPLTAELTR
jgi:hypothetical protein